VQRILENINPEAALLNHYGMHVWQAKPWLIAEDLTEKTGVRVTAARDGMKFDLTKLEVIKQNRTKE
jgi:hypothetical protein